MGLDINKYSYSYSVLQQLRQLALNYEGINIPICDFYDQFEITTKFNEFIIHCDCEGLYISKSSKQYEKYKKEAENRYGQLFCYFGDLDKLKEEVKELHPFMLKKNRRLIKSCMAGFL